MNGTAIYLSIAAIFIAQLFNIELSFIQLILLTIGCIGVAFFSSLIPYASLLMLGLVLNFADFPLHALAGIGLLLTVDWLFERLRAVVNLLGDAVGAAVIGNSFDFKTARAKPLKTSSKPTFHKGRRLPERKKSIPPKKDFKKKDSRKFSDKPKPGKIQKKKIDKTVKKTVKPKKTTAVKKKTTSKVELPPAPFHLLDTELKPKNNKTEKAPKETVVNGASLPDETIERERTKVAAQLAKIRDNEIITEKDSSEPKKEEKSENGFSKIDFISDDSPVIDDSKKQDPEVEKVAEVKEEIEATVDEKDSEPEKQVSYGRGKSKRGPSPKADDASEEKQDSQDEPDKTEDAEKPAYDTENVSFGRTKKKK
jgi:hypothetical protein